MIRCFHYSVFLIFIINLKHGTCIFLGDFMLFVENDPQIGFYLQTIFFSIDIYSGIHKFGPRNESRAVLTSLRKRRLPQVPTSSTSLEAPNFYICFDLAIIFDYYIFITKIVFFCGILDSKCTSHLASLYIAIFVLLYNFTLTLNTF